MSKNALDAKSFNKILSGVIGAIAFLTLVAGIYFVINLNNLSKEVSKNKYLAENNSKKIEALTQLDSDYKQFSTEADQIESYLPDKKDVSSLLRDLEAMAGRNGLNFSSYQVGSGQSNTVSSKSKSGDLQLQKGSGYMIFPFQIVLKGSYAKVDDMMKQIEGYNRLVEIKGVKYSKDYTSPGDAVEADLTLNAYLK